MRKILEQCPTCGQELEITHLRCTFCETEISGRYQPCRFCKLSPDSFRFLESFVRNRGNVKDMERELGISYWTVRSRLNDVIEELGFEVDSDREQEMKARRQEILEQVARGEISAAEAANLLSQLK